MTSDLIDQVRLMYNEAGEYFSKTRQKRYGGKDTNWPLTKRYLDKLKEGERVLDVGCGNGRLVTGLPKGVSYKGIDFSKTLIQEAQKQHPKFEFRYGNLVDEYTWENLGKYDAAFSVAVLHHLPERAQQVMVLRKMREAVKERGWMFLSVWNLWQPRFLQYHLASMELKKQDEKFLNVPFNKEWQRFCVAMDIPYLTSVVIEAGWEIKTIDYYDRAGKKALMSTGENIVVVGKNLKG